MTACNARSRTGAEKGVTLVSANSYEKDFGGLGSNKAAARKVGETIAKRALEKGITNSVASCTLMIEMGEQVHFSMGSEKNIKLTTVDDIDIFKALLLAKRADWLKD